MTARQPPGEKGAKACTIGCDSSRDGYFCALFSGRNGIKGAKSNEQGREIRCNYTLGYIFIG